MQNNLHGYRENLFIALNEEQIDIILDIHSFPSSSFDGEEIVLLANTPFDEFNINLSRYIKAKIGIARRGYNAIIDYSKERKIYSALIEIREDLGDNQIEYYSDTITMFIRSIQYN